MSVDVKGRIMGVDFGEARTGVAVSDVNQYLASGLGYIKCTGINKIAEAVAARAAEQNVVRIVVGMPVNMNGTEGESAARVRKFAELLRGLTGIEVILSDERLTTAAASRYLNVTDTRGKKRREVIDSLSAQILLQNYLDRM